MSNIRLEQNSRPPPNRKPTKVELEIAKHIRMEDNDSLVQSEPNLIGEEEELAEICE